MAMQVSVSLLFKCFFLCVSRSYTTYVYVQAKKKVFAKIEDVGMTND